jgi:hypothetical protein
MIAELNVLTNDIGDILDMEEPSHCIYIDYAHFNPLDCSRMTCICCFDRCDEVSQNKDHPTY